jgi:hypothetical protein
MGLMRGPEPDKDKGRKTATPFNKSGIFAGGSTGSGAYKYVKPEEQMSPGEKRDYLRKAASSDIFRGGVTGSGVVKSGMYGEKGTDKYKYVTIVEPNRDDRPASKEYTSGDAPRQGRDDGDGRRGSDNDSSGSDSDSSPKGGPGSLNYYMKKTLADGRPNAKNRAYTLMKRERKRARQRGNDS